MNAGAGSSLARLGGSPRRERAEVQSDVAGARAAAAPAGRRAVGCRMLGPGTPPRRPDPQGAPPRAPALESPRLPRGPTTGASGLAPVLRERLASAGDSLIAMGCTGACQPVLGLEELDREIAWGLRNPWSTGLADVLGRRPAAVAPRLADLDRPGAAALFLRHGLALVGTAAADRPLSFSGHYGLRVFPYARVPLGGAAARSLDADLRRLMALSGDVFLMIDLAALPPAPAAAAPLIETFAERVLGSGRAVVPLADAALDGETRQPADGRAIGREHGVAPVPRRALRRRLEAAEGPRRGAAGAATRRATCSPCSPRRPRASAAAPGAPRRYTDRGLIAHMQGEATLSGDVFDVRLAGGRFCGLARGPGSPDAPAPGRSPGCGSNGRTLAARGRSAFSFEGDDGTGLREDLVLEPGGSLVVDYTFRGDHPSLAVEASYTFPALTPGAVVEEWAPLALALAEVPRGREIPVAFEAPDGSTARASWRSGTAGGRRPVRASAVKAGDGGGRPRERRRRRPPAGACSCSGSRWSGPEARAGGQPVRRRRSRARRHGSPARAAPSASRSGWGGHERGRLRFLRRRPHHHAPRRRRAGS